MKNLRAKNPTQAIKENMMDKKPKLADSGTVKQIIITAVYVLSLTLSVIGIMFLTICFDLKSIKLAGRMITAKENVGNTTFVFGAILAFTVAICVYYKIDAKASPFKQNNMVLLPPIIIVSIILCFLSSEINLYLRPYALSSMLSVFLIGKRHALINTVYFAILMMLIDSVSSGVIFLFDRELIVSFLLTVIIGAISVFMLDGVGSRIKVILTGVILSIPALLASFGLELSSGYYELLKSVNSAFLSGVLAAVLTTVILPIFESLFRVVTTFRLEELTDHKQKLLKELAERAPGTFNHTVIVAMIAEACSNAIGENPLLARACAYYHDVGKLKNPEMFTENQTGYNPHDDLSPELSTDIIRSHAQDGAKLIRQSRLPEVIAETAEQHHGTMPIRYFYVKAQKYTDGELDISRFCYQGPKPLTKINVIIMISDACEARVRSIKDRTYENVNKAVGEMIEERLDMDQLSECDITLKELSIIKNTITNTLAGVYHDRVKYPKLKAGGKNA